MNTEENRSLDVEINMNIPIPQEKVLPIKRSYSFFLGVIYCILGFLILPFIILDLFVAYTNDTCNYSDNFSHYLNLKIWLQVAGYFHLILLIYIIIYIYILTYILYDNIQNEDHKTLYRILNSFNKYSFLFELIWVIIGSIIFYKFIEDCDSKGYNYIFIRFLINYLYLGVILLLKFKIKGKCK